jgi:hypothetical protein
MKMGGVGKIKPAALPGLTGSDTALRVPGLTGGVGAMHAAAAPASAKQFKPGIKLP